MKTKLESTLSDPSIEQLLSDLARKWPSAIVAREKIAEFSGGLLHPRTLANLASLNQGPPSIKIGRKVVYPIRELCDWLKDRIEKKPIAPGDE